MALLLAQAAAGQGRPGDLPGSRAGDLEIKFPLGLSKEGGQEIGRGVGQKVICLPQEEPFLGFAQTRYSTESGHRICIFGFHQQWVKLFFWGWEWGTECQCWAENPAGCCRKHDMIKI